MRGSIRVVREGRWRVWSLARESSGRRGFEIVTLRCSQVFVFTSLSAARREQQFPRRPSRRRLAANPVDFLTSQKVSRRCLVNDGGRSLSRCSRELGGCGDGGLVCE